jgi:streptogramin lyase
MRRSALIGFLTLSALLTACGGGGGNSNVPGAASPANPQPGGSPLPGSSTTPSPGSSGVGSTPTPAPSGGSTSTGTFVEYPVPVPATSGNVYGLTVGPDGNVWFTRGATVGYITPSGSFTTYDETPLAQGTPGPSVGNIARGSGSTLWFQYGDTVVQNGTIEPARNNYVYQISTSGTIGGNYNQSGCDMPAHCLSTVVVEPGSQNDVLLAVVDSTEVSSSLYDLTSAGNLVMLDHTGMPDFTQYLGMVEIGNQIWVAAAPIDGFGVVTPGGTMTTYSWPSGFGPNASSVGSEPNTYQVLAVGPDGAPWVTLTNLNSTTGECALGRLGAGGGVTVFPVSTTTDCGLAGITTGPDGALWFTEGRTNKLGRMTTTGSVTEYPVPTASAGLGRIVSASGSLWFTEQATNKIGRYTP